MTLLQEPAALKKTPLYDRHVALGGKIVNFGGWALPVYYESLLTEHRWTREHCGLFDVSHLGEILVEGPGAFQFLQYRLTNDLRKLEEGKIIYSLLLDERGRTLDDILIYGSRPGSYYLIVNASNIARDMEALKKYAPEDARLVDLSDQMACIAVQGPKAETVLEKLFGFTLQALPYYHWKEERFQGETVWVSRSGYTGEDGFEIFSKNELAPAIWDRLNTDGRAEGVKPAGLGARNTLRLEAGNVLYGNELDETTTPLEAGLKFAVSFEKGGFVGRDLLMVQNERGPARLLVGFKVLDKAIAREHYPIYGGGHKIGSVTSGSFGPTANANIGMGYVERKFAVPGTTIEIEIHGRRIPAEVVKRPFVTKNHKKGL